MLYKLENSTSSFGKSFLVGILMGCVVLTPYSAYRYHTVHADLVESQEQNAELIQQLSDATEELNRLVERSKLITQPNKEIN